MLLKEYTKTGKYKFILALKKNEFNFFLNKFYGSLISKGKKGIAMSFFNQILINFKEKFKSDPFREFNKSINNLIPILSYRQKRMGKVYHTIPRLARGKRRFVIMLGWILKKQKNKTNVRGISIKEVSRHLIDAVSKKGLLIKLKRQHLAYSLSGKHLLYMNKKRPFMSVRKYKQLSFNQLLQKTDIYQNMNSKDFLQFDKTKNYQKFDKTKNYRKFDKKKGYQKKTKILLNSLNTQKYGKRNYKKI